MDTAGTQSAHFGINWLLIPREAVSLHSVLLLHQRKTQRLHEEAVLEIRFAVGISASCTLPCTMKSITCSSRLPHSFVHRHFQRFVRSFGSSSTPERAHEGVIRQLLLARGMEVRQDDHNASPLASKYLNLLISSRASKLKKSPPLQLVSICLCKGKAATGRICN